MSREEEELASMRAICPSASVVVDGNVRAVFLPEFPFQANSVSRRMDLILYPGPHTGYASRLFFSECIDCTRRDGTKPNWQTAVVAGRTWSTPSWKDVPADLPWTEMLGAHLRALL